MGKRVANIYGKTTKPEVMTLEVISSGIYDIEVTFDTAMHEHMTKYSWCFERSKGLLYTMDLTLDLPTKMGYSTARVYLRDFIMYHTKIWGANRPSCVWEKSLDTYCITKGRFIPLHYRD